MLTPTFVDFESVSRCDLRKHGGRLYWEHPSTRVLCAVLHGPGVGGGRLEWWPALGPLFLPGDPPVECMAAHNARGFDLFAWRRLGWPEPRRVVDTSHAARRAGMAGALSALAALVGHDVKDKEGSRLTVGLSTCRRPTKALGPGREITPAVWSTLSADEKRERGVQKDPTPEELARIVQYCGRDVDAMVEAWPLIEPFAHAEPEVEAADAAVNDRGICFDRELAEALLAIDDAQAKAACASVGLAPSELRSPARFAAHVAAAGGFAPDATSATVEALTRVPGRVGALAEARLALASIARGKLEAGRARCSADGRLRDSMKIIGAHTWRWSHTGLQPGNIPWIEKRA